MLPLFATATHHNLTRIGHNIGFGGHLGFFHKGSTDKVTYYIPKYHCTKNGAFIRSGTVIPLSHSTTRKHTEYEQPSKPKKSPQLMKQITCQVGILAAVLVFDKKEEWFSPKCYLAPAMSGGGDLGESYW